MIINKKSNDPMWKLDQMINAIYSSKYPNINSVVNDPLRSNIQEAYGINLNMFDTHRFLFSSNIGVCEDIEYYFYEGPYEKIKAIFNNGKDGEDALDFGNHICGVYPEGILLGFFATEFKDPEFRRTHMKDYADFLFWTAYNLSNKRIDTSSAYHFYNEHLDLIYLFKRMENDEVPITSLKDIEYKCFYSFDIMYDMKKVIAIMENFDEFKKAVNSYSWSKVYKFFNDRNVIDEFYTDEERTDLMKKLEIYDSHKAFFDKINEECGLNKKKKDKDEESASNKEESPKRLEETAEILKKMKEKEDASK